MLLSSCLRNSRHNLYGQATRPTSTHRLQNNARRNNNTTTTTGGNNGGVVVNGLDRSPLLIGSIAATCGSLAGMGGGFIMIPVRTKCDGSNE